MQTTAFTKYNDETEETLRLSARKQEELTESLERTKEVNLINKGIDLAI